MIISGDFNPRSPHGERHLVAIQKCLDHQFQPTLPARGATRQPLFVVVLSTLFQPTLPARGATKDAPRGDFRCAHFNPRSPHGERRASSRWRPRASNFNPRSPHGERQRSAGQVYGAGYFNPRSPHGERPETTITNVETDLFQPTLPARGATRSVKGLSSSTAISTHAPRTGSDKTGFCPEQEDTIFQPTLPARGATARFQIKTGLVPISTHAPRTGSDAYPAQYCA